MPRMPRKCKICRASDVDVAEDGSWGRCKNAFQCDHRCMHAMQCSAVQQDAKSMRGRRDSIVIGSPHVEDANARC